MKVVQLVALLVALATPAWAYNDSDVEEALSLERFKICITLNHNYPGCHMQHSPEKQALSLAKSLLETCDDWDKKGTPVASCAGWRAYIKQRWGY